MISLVLSVSLIVIACVIRLSGDDATQIVLYACVLGALVLAVLRQGLLTNLGAFLLLAFLMYGMRPLYILFHSDRKVLNALMGGVDVLPYSSYSMFVATLAMLAICVGHAVARIIWPAKAYPVPPGVARSAYFPKLTGACSLALLCFQAFAIVFLLALRGPAAASLYSAAGGAYTYLFPQVLQAAQIFILVIFVHNRHEAPPAGRVRFHLSLAMFVVFTFLMKDVSIFRGFYITGAIGAVLAIIYAQRGRVAYWVLLLPVMFLLPAFRALGAARQFSADQAFGFAFDVMMSFSPQKWWSFFDGKGDMNVFDTFVAAIHSTPAFKPYFMAWLYTFVHYIPRAWWPGKPPRGILIDISFTKGYPYHPGLAGFYYLDGGMVWMFVSCLITGGLLYALDRWIYCSRPGYLHSALFGILIINSLYAARGYLHFQIIQYIYMVVPVLLLAWAVAKFGTVPTRQTRARARQATAA